MSSCVVLRKKEVEKTLETSPTSGKHLLEPLKSFAAASGFPMKILEDREVINPAEVHTHEGDLWQCLEGEVIFICGGELIEPKAKKNPDNTFDEREWSGSGIRGGTEMVLRPGDWLWVPPGEPHQHNCKGLTRLVIIKIPKV